MFPCVTKHLPRKTRILSKDLDQYDRFLVVALKSRKLALHSSVLAAGGVFVRGEKVSDKQRLIWSGSQVSQAARAPPAPPNLPGVPFFCQQCTLATFLGNLMGAFCSISFSHRKRCNPSSGIHALQELDCYVQGFLMTIGLALKPRVLGSKMRFRQLRAFGAWASLGVPSWRSIRPTRRYSSAALIHIH